METLKKETAKQVFNKAKEIIENDNLLFSPEKTRLQFDTWVDGGEETYTMAVITNFEKSIYTYSQAWNSNENGSLFEIKTDSALDLIERMQYAAIIKSL